MVEFSTDKRVYVSSDWTHAIVSSDLEIYRHDLVEEYRDETNNTDESLRKVFNNPTKCGVISALELRKFLRLARELGGNLVVKVSTTTENGVILEAFPFNGISAKRALYSTGGEPVKTVYTTEHMLRTIAEKIYKNAKQIVFEIVDDSSPFAVYEYEKDNMYFVVCAPFNIGDE